MIEDFVYRVRYFDNNTMKIKDESFKKDFLHSSLQEQITIYQSENNPNQRVFDIFGFFLFVEKVTPDEHKEKKSMPDYCAYHLSGEKSEIEVSKILRNSTTLKQIEGENAYINGDIHVTFAERGFAFCNNYNNDEGVQKFEKVFLSFLLANAYNKKAEKFLQDVSSSFKNNLHVKLIEAKEDICIFDLLLYLSNPVKQSHQQQYTIYELIAKNYNVHQIHDEIKTQVIDLSSVIESKLQKLSIEQKEDEEKQKECKKEQRRKEKEDEQKLKDIADEKDRNFQKKMLIIGVIISVASLISVIKDSIDLLGMF